MREKSDLRDASFQDLESLAIEVENIAYQLENVCERLDAQHATVVTALLAIMRKTGAELPPEIVNAHRPDEDELYDKARQAVIEAGKASASFLQRRLGLGYSRAARLLDLLEENGVISAEDGVKPREVLKTE